jgi:hypothetical protein
MSAFLAYWSGMFDIYHHHFDTRKIEEQLMAVSQQISDLIAQAKINTSIEQSADLALKALALQIADLGKQIAALQAKLDAGTPLSAEDIAALSTEQAELAASAQTLQTDVPANTTPPPAPSVTSAPGVGNLNVNPLTGQP